MQAIKDFKKKNEYLICIDSDGTAIDAMNVKHNKCHGPSFIEEWGLEGHQEEMQYKWNKINLYNSTRGVNRYIALLEILEEINGEYLSLSDEELKTLSKWVINTTDLSNNGLKKEIEKNESPILKKAYNWSININKKISALTPEDKKPFPGVISCLEYAHEKVDIAVVSSSNMDAIQKEWGHYDMLKYLDVMTSQEVGTKGECIAEMIKKGYKPENVLMIGDALPDVDAAKENKTFFYPILTEHEEKSWLDLEKLYLNEFTSGKFGKHQELLMEKFNKNFGQ